jgi:hypothetical protein
MEMAFCIFCKVLLFCVKSILVDYEQEEKSIKNEYRNGFCKFH